MRVVFATFFKESMGGGAGRVAFEIAESFARQGHETVLILPGTKTQVRKIAPHLRYLEIKSLSNEEDVAIPYLTVKNLQFLFNFLEKFSPQVIHVHDFGPICLVSQFWAINHQTPFVYTSHVLPSKSSEFIGEKAELFGKFLETKLIQKYFANFYRNCDALVALNQPIVKEFAQRGFKQKTFLIPNGRNLKTYWSKKPALISEENKQLTFIGHICRRKNQTYLVRVMEYLPADYTLNLIGKGLSPESLKELKNYIVKKKIKNVLFTGQIPHEKITEFLQKTHVFVSAAKIEVQSLVIIEALASGTPVVGLSNETVDELVDNQVGFWFGKKTPPKVFAAKVKEICELGSKEYQQLCQNAQKKVAHLDWPEIVKRTVSLYQKLIPEKKKNDSQQQKRRSRLTREILDLLPSSKTKTFLKKQIFNPSSKIKPKKSIFLLGSTVVVTFFMGVVYLLSRGSKKLLGQ